MDYNLLLEDIYAKIKSEDLKHCNEYAGMKRTKWLQTIEAKKKIKKSW